MWANSRIPTSRGKSLEQLIDDLQGTALPGSQVHEVMKAAIQVRIAERLAAPQRWAIIAAGAAMISALAAVASAIAAFA